MVYKNLNLYLIFIVFSQLFLLANGQFTPGPRLGHKAVLVGKRIYFIGGRNYNKGVDPTSDFFYFDFGTGSGSIVDLRSQGVNLPYTIWHTANIGGVNQDLIYIIGGVQLDETNLVYQFDTKSNTLSVPIIQGITPPRRRDMDSVSYQGKIYMFSGRTFDVNNEFFNNFDILDTVNLNWGVGSLVNAPPPRFGYTATLVNGVIYYIGGLQKIGTNPQVDGKICVYGGSYLGQNMQYSIPAQIQIAMLDITTLTWSIPQLQNANTPKLDDLSIPNLVYHSATLLDKSMLVAFGNLTDSVPHVPNENYYLFDLNQPTIQWFKITSDGTTNPINPNIPNAPNAPFAIPKSTPNSTTSATSDANQQQSSSNNMLVIGLSAGLGAIGLGTVVAFLLLYRRVKKNQSIATGGGEIGHSGGQDASGVVLQIPSNADKNYPTMNHFESTRPTTSTTPQYVNSNPQQNYSPTPTLTQSQGYYSPGQEFSTTTQPQGYSPGQEFPSSTSTLNQSQGYSPGQEFSTLPQKEVFAKHSSNYFPGCESITTPPPPPIKT
ncbi:hypothetical protein C1645_810689 [Glomus cerebriforme]|uniref:Galactose oxidase n=1 Tax=Glomus cerebriforme TaxID=658196 RepID=A0A397S611_9GLOM|nr:hypothetical protein C1645_810689 [Glomus cerebriforme]